LRAQPVVTLTGRDTRGPTLRAARTVWCSRTSWLA